MDPAVFVRRKTAVAAPPLVPEIRLHLATEVTPIWQATEETLAHSALPPPFWAFAWAGGQALARYLLDHPAEVEDRAAEIDHFAAAAIAANAALNDVAIAVRTADVLDSDDPRWEVVAAGDVCYERPMADRVTGWLRRLAARGPLVLIGDPGRAYLPSEGLVERARYLVPVSRELEDRDTRDTIVWEVLPR